MKKLSFVDESWEDYLYWLKVDKKLFKRLNQLIKETLRNPFEGLGKPEPLKYKYQGCWSRRINQEHRLVYKVLDNEIIILSCRFHYD
ncbi:MAG: Txe/YoeB family addiction module toxin [Bacteroidales bacterium]|jgi:toxin YoeB|nr:Txe/YoeB family addiction module toxin [Bacteroidales bacterium]